MAGANYMGGKRNAAKAKSRDKTGRIQKDFFGRRRLNILSKGLGVLPRSEEGTTRGPNAVATRTSIALGHAKKATTAAANEPTPQSISTSTTSASSVSQKRKRGHEPVTQPHSSSPNSKVSIGTTTSSIRSTKSKLLQQLDLLEPISSQAAISRILSMPDLAGLCSGRKRIRLDSLLTSPALDGHNETFSAEDTVEHGSESQPERYGTADEDSRAHSSRGTCSPQLADSEFFQHSVSPARCDKSEGSHICDGNATCWSSSVSRSGEPRKVGSSGSADWSGLHTSLSTTMRPSEHDSEGDTSSIASFGSEEPRRSRGSRRSSTLLDEERSVGGMSHSPGCSSADIRRTRTSNIIIPTENRCKNLLDYSDPWEQIGVVLGLSKNYRGSSKEQKTLWTGQEGVEERDTNIFLESDLPPSDIACDDTLDDTLYDQPSSLPLAESSDTTKLSSNLVGEPDHIPWDEDFVLDFDSSGDIEGAPADIHPLSEAVEAPEKAAIATGMSLNAPGTDGALTERVDATIVTAELAPVNVVEKSQPKLAVLPMIGSPELKRPSDELSWSEGLNVRCSQERENVSQDVVNGNDNITDIARLINQNEDVLSAPQLLEYNGVYRGPCLLSEESEYSELEE